MSVDHNWRSIFKIPYDETLILKPVSIGDAVWVGQNVMIAPGVNIGSGAIISMGSVVFSDVPDCTIVRGNPAVEIKRRNTEEFWRMYDEQAFF